MYRDAELRKHQYYVNTNWSGTLLSSLDRFKGSHSSFQTKVVYTPPHLFPDHGEPSHLD